MTTATARPPTAGQLVMDLSKRQTLAWDTLERDDVESVCYGGAKGGGKSVLLCYWAYYQCLKIIKQFGLTWRKHPIPVGWLGRLRSKDFGDTTLETWKRFIPPEGYQLREHDSEIVIGPVKLVFGGLDNRESVHKFNSAEYGFICVDQAEEVPEDRIDVLKASRRLSIRGVPIRPKALYTANPGPGWLKEQYWGGSDPAKRFIQALPSDNPYLPESYVDILTDAFKHRPELLEAYLRGNWESFEGADQVILDRWLRQAARLKKVRQVERRFLVCDPAEFGDDETVIYTFEDSDIVAQKIYGKKSKAFTANLLHTMALKVGATAVVVDACGLGEAVVHLLQVMTGGAYRVIPLNSAEPARDKAKYANTRAEMWFTAAAMLEEGDIALSADQWMDDDDYRMLVAELCAPTYGFAGQKLKLVKKEETKKLLGRSPDRGDTAVMGWYSLPRVPKLKQPKDDYGRGRRSGKKRSAMAA